MKRGRLIKAYVDRCCKVGSSCPDGNGLLNATGAAEVTLCIQCYGVGAWAGIYRGGIGGIRGLAISKVPIVTDRSRAAGLILKTNGERTCAGSWRGEIEIGCDSSDYPDITSRDG